MTILVLACETCEINRRTINAIIVELARKTNCRGQFVRVLPAILAPFGLICRNLFGGNSYEDISTWCPTTKRYEVSVVGEVFVAIFDQVNSTCGDAPDKMRRYDFFRCRVSRQKIFHRIVIGGGCDLGGEGGRCSKRLWRCG